MDIHDLDFYEGLPDTDYSALANPLRHGNKRGQHWQDTRQPSAGAERFGFISFALPEQPVIGSAVAQTQQLAIVEPNLLYVNGVALPLDGIGGVIAGGINLQALVDPNQPGA